MRGGRLFWGGVLIFFGLLLLLDNLGYLQPLGISVWNLLWPAFLILIGLSILWGTIFRRGSEEAETASVPLEGAEEAAITFHHGAGRLHVKGGAGQGELLSGSFVGGVGVDSRKRGGALEVDLKVPSEGMWIFPWTWFNSQGFNWQVDLTTATPLALTMKSGASDTYLDLSELMVKDLKIETGASSTEVLLPRAAGYTRVDIDSGAASVTLHVPENVAADIKVDGGLSGITVNRSRFPQNGNRYRSPDYDTAANKVEIDVDMGVGSVDIR